MATHKRIVRRKRMVVMLKRNTRNIVQSSSAYQLVCSLVLPLLAAVTCIAMHASHVHGQLPATKLYAIYPMGGKVGTSFDLAITNAADDDQAHKLVFSHPGITAKPKMAEKGIYKSAKPIARQFAVTIAKDVPAGIYEVRAVGLYGLSNPRAFVVGSLDEANEKGGNQTREKAEVISVGATVNGRVDVRSFDFYKVQLKKGQRVLVTCAAEDIDSRITAIITLYNTKGIEVKQTSTVPGYDPMVDFIAPADGEYFVSVHDLLYGGGGDYFYRLSVHTGPFIDFIDPPSAMAGTKAKVAIFGRNLPGGKPTNVLARDGAKLQKLDVTIDVPRDVSGKAAIDGYVHPAGAGLDAVVYQLKSPQGDSNPVRFYVASAPIVREVEPNDSVEKANVIKIPTEFTGTFGPKRDRDYVQFEATQGQKIVVDLISHRMGLPTDATLLIQQITKDAKGVEKVKDIDSKDDSYPNIGGTRFDTTSSDSTVSFTASATGIYRVKIRNQHYSSYGDPRLQYRLVVRTSDQSGAGGFRLVAMSRGVVKDPKKPADIQPGATLLRRGATDRIVVLAYRTGGFSGPIEVAVQGAPAGVVVEPLTIPANAKSGSLVVRAKGDAASWAGFLNIIGKAKVDGKDVSRKALGASLVWGGETNKTVAKSRMTTGVALAVTDVETMPVTVLIDGSRSIEISRAGKISVPIKLEKRDGFNEKVAVAATGIPKNTLTSKPINIDKGKTDGKLEFVVGTKCPLNSYAIAIQATTSINYKKNPAALKAAEASKVELDQTSKALAEAAKKSGEAHKQAAAAYKKVEAEFKKAKADQQQQLKSQVDDAKKNSELASESAKQDAVMAKLATDELKKVDSRIASLKKAKPQKVNIVVPAGAVVVNVTASPVDVVVSAIKLKQNSEVEVSAKLARKYGFDDVVTVELQPAKGVSGVTLAKPVKVEKGKGDAKLLIKASSKAKEGKHSFTLRIKTKFNGQSLSVDQPVSLTIEKGDPPVKKGK
jgi:hypothetical protein